MASRRCVYCSCTEDRACAIPIDEIEDPAVRDAHARFLAELAAAAPDAGPIPAIIACWWIQLEPPVCSAPACAARLAADRIAQHLAADDTSGDASRVIVGQGAR